MAPARTRILRIVLWGSVALLSASLGGAFLLREYASRQPHNVQVSGEALVRSKFSLVDHRGRAVTEVDFSGRWQLVFFGFTHCPDICPTTLAYMAGVLDSLGERADSVAPLFITVDPVRDTVDVMAEYVSAFHPRLVGLTGSPEQVAAAAQEFKVYFEQREDTAAPNGYLMAHSGYIYLMRPGGRFEAVFREGDQPPEALAEEIQMRIAKDDRQ